VYCLLVFISRLAACDLSTTPLVVKLSLSLSDYYVCIMTSLVDRVKNVVSGGSERDTCMYHNSYSSMSVIDCLH